MGDFNAQVSNDNTNAEAAMGKHGIGRLTENGNLFVELCMTNKFVIGGTLFPHKRIHKVTWVSPDNVTENQIDHITISKKWRSSLLDVRNKRGADVLSDHHLIIALIRIKLAALKKNGQAIKEKLNVKSLQKPQKRKLYSDALKTSLRQLPADRNWDSTKKAFLDSAEKYVGYLEKKRKEWISDETWQKIAERKNAKMALNNARTRSGKTQFQAKYSKLDRVVKHNARRDKRKWAENIAKEAQAAAETNRTRDLYQAAKRLTNSTKVSSKPIKDDSGKLVTSTDTQLQLWTDFYRKMLETHRGESESICDCVAHLENPNVNTECPSNSEICDAIKCLKNNKSPGADNIAPELLRADPLTSAELLQPIIANFWKTEALPNELAEGIIVKLPKKGDLSERKNWRGITLISMVNKIIAHILNRRLAAVILPNMRKEQAGFRPRKSCVDHVNSLRIIVEQSVEWRSPLYMVFIDFEKAFDTLEHDAIWKVLGCKGIPKKMISLVKALYAQATCRILHENQLGDKIAVKCGVRQGCILSPLLFNTVLDTVMLKATKEKRGIPWGLTERLEDLDYADDICLLSSTAADMKRKIEQVVNFATKVGLRINVDKTKSIRINTECNEHFFIYNKPLENVDRFCYLGSIIDKCGGSSADVVNRLAKARQAFGALGPMWNSRVISRRTKLKVFESNVKSILLYGCQTWNAASKDIQKVQVFVNKCLRQITKIFWPNTITNDNLWHLTQQQPINTEIVKRKWNWIGHTLRKPLDEIARSAITWNPQGSRRRGRPAHTWRRQLETEMEKLQLCWNEIKTHANDRTAWKKLVTALCSLTER